jgi:hypothetical protein
LIASERNLSAAIDFRVKGGCWGVKLKMDDEVGGPGAVSPLTDSMSARTGGDRAIVDVKIAVDIAVHREKLLGDWARVRGQAGCQGGV